MCRGTWKVCHVENRSAVAKIHSLTNQRDHRSHDDFADGLDSPGKDSTRIATKSPRPRRLSAERQARRVSSAARTPPRKFVAKAQAVLTVRPSRFLRSLERKPSDYRVVAEAGANAVDGVLGDCGAAVDQVGGIGLIRRDKRTGADAAQPEARAVGLALEQVAGRSENSAGKLGRRVKRTRSGANFEIRGFQ